MLEQYLERKAARAKARNLLLSQLNEAQREGVEQGLGFEVVAKSGTRYRIRPGNTVQKLDPGGSFPLVTLCVVIKPPEGVEWMPEDDYALAQKLLLESDEEEFLRLAIRAR